MNERLRSALVQRGLTVDEVAAACEVDPKTASRWVAGRVPHRRNRWTVANLLKIDEAYLWPETGQRTSRLGAAQSELVDTYANRASVPRDIWMSLLSGAMKQIDVLVFSGTFFAQTNPHITRMLQERAQAGVRVRLCFGDPEGEAVRIRGEEEGIGDTLAAKIRASLTYYRDLVGHPGCEVRLHDTTLYTSIFRYDDHLMANPHIWGLPASANPLLQLRRTPGGEWFERYGESFDAVWSTARPWVPDSQEQYHHGQD
ncbi:MULTISPECIES: helix-turn-helix domain-containing protein [Streptomyces]|uniref:XRE family transcriptional regulator n=1 Tax=Streptomyces tsukubensis (strain DSM 42081 / NBRC 108919 / NRRL 18488 / 9993) TaxID=1114943 RepID=A0A7G3UER5_STRT9|nr:helix-turn-helix domain-containing protein [Streptomyces tsukubensis]AZK95017.1 transcriptional regulator [Streptomyces tsukubensis]MYS63160.1 XRE family transcriptional regulator [Streptomyces sp. SID5473]QKM68917.1 XRE family transcriptional regulator [Streptomyces tsukubensis NRRL18488]TAI43723.1 XRE family transcriptional regulator [Streptomyces tsukubensis]